MRVLLVAIAVVLSVSAANAQEMTPAAGANDRALPAKPSPGIIEQLKAVGELKDRDEPKRLEAPAPNLGAEVKPTQPAPAQTAAPVEAKQAETPPVVAQPVEAKPAEAAPAPKVVTISAETKAVETKPAPAQPEQVAAAPKPAKKKVVRKRETDEQKARRIAAKYGISW